MLKISSFFRVEETCFCCCSNFYPTITMFGMVECRPKDGGAIGWEDSESDVADDTETETTEVPDVTEAAGRMLCY